SALTRKITPARDRDLCRRHSRRAWSDISDGTGSVYWGLIDQARRSKPYRGRKAGCGDPTWSTCLELPGNLFPARQRSRRRKDNKRVRARAEFGGMAERPKRACPGSGGSKGRRGEPERGAGSHACFARPLSDATAVAATGGLCVSQLSGGATPGSPRGRSRRWGLLMALSQQGAWQRRAFLPGYRLYAWAISRWVAPARRQP